ncbi:hypothetical protein EV213_104188 [Aureibacillus halotolerans]|uniref:Uncharacterized protein n=1 Tax=Aureibacillus halotolerans TaxID=1508390 RepID=A0A4R6U428_9BACI|nr:hypothetical protein EV213_104188 [Aureibacillus halotolerans]
MVIAPIMMVFLAVIPFSVIYDQLSTVLLFLPKFDSPPWFVPAGFISIICIVILAFVIGKTAKH